METHTEPLHWYALKVFFNKVFDVEQLIARDGQESYIPCETVTVEKTVTNTRNGVRWCLPSCLFIPPNPMP